MGKRGRKGRIKKGVWLKKGGEDGKGGKHKKNWREEERKKKTEVGIGNGNEGRKLI